MLLAYRIETKVHVDTFLMLLTLCLVAACTNCFVIVTIKTQRNIYNLTVDINISPTLYPFYCTMYIIVDNCIVEYNSYYDQCISCNYNILLSSVFAINFAIIHNDNFILIQE